MGSQHPGWVDMEPHREWEVTWIGFSDVEREGHWLWASGSPATYTNWSPGEPTNHGYGEDCAVLVRNGGVHGQWIDVGCGTELPYCCASTLAAGIAVVTGQISMDVDQPQSFISDAKVHEAFKETLGGFLAVPPSKVSLSFNEV